jgi:uncharacterized membrane protein YeiH
VGPGPVPARRSYPRRVSTAALLTTLDLVGLFVFALSGAAAAVSKRLDLFGVVVLGLVAATGGGALRDVLLGAVPPLVLSDWRYLAVPAVAAVVTFRFHPQLARLRRLVLLSDAAGLGLFVVAGTSKALAAGVAPLGACVVGALTGIGGGVLRDLLVGEIPVVLRREIYAVAALAGAVVVVVADRLGAAGTGSAVLAAVLVGGLRVVSLLRRWSAPTPRGVGPDGSGAPR